MSARTRLHPDVLRLGWVSLLTDVSSEMVFSVFAVVFTSVAGASAALLGLIEGLADLSASSLNAVSGWLSDRSGRRKVYALLGYGFSTLAKALLLVGTAAGTLAAFRVIERLGKGFRGPPRDAWLAAIAAGPARGYAFGVHKALDKAGAVIGPLLAWMLISVLGESAGTYQTLFWIAFAPAVLAVIVLARLEDRPAPPRSAVGLVQGWRALGPGLRRFLLPAGIFALGYYSLGFLLVRAHQLGFGVSGVVLLYALFNAVCVLAAPLVGLLGDRIGRRRIVPLGYALYGLVNLGLLVASQGWELIALFVLYGIFYAIEESQSRAFVVDLEPQSQATAIGLYNLVTGSLYLPASLLAGVLWTVSPAAAFGVAAAISALAMLGFAIARPPCNVPPWNSDDPPMHV
jgi:MFS family permease